MSDLVEFLRARLGEDEAVALAATAGPWHKVDGGVTDLADAWPVSMTEYDNVDNDQADRAHIARHDPARVLADVEAKRRIIADREHIDASAGDTEWHSGYSDGNYDALRALALPYADHPDYDESWRP